ncbi:MAG: hypothetical protein PHV74_14700 [Dehalococcoidia bacterium]|nr:hypothetical protein [Dehalococcoidia bacterium]
MKKKVLLALLVIGIILSVETVAALALLDREREDTEGVYACASTGIDLKLSDPDEPDPRNGVTATWAMENIKPGDETGGWVRLYNTGSTAGHRMDIAVFNAVIDPPGPESDAQENTLDLDKQMMITDLQYTYCNGKRRAGLSDLRDMDGDGYISLDDFERQGLSIAANHPPGKNKYYTLSMSLRFNPMAGNEYQGDQVTMTMRFTLSQGR